MYRRWRQGEKKEGKESLVYRVGIRMMLKTKIKVLRIRLCHPQDGGTSPKYKLLHFLTTIISLNKRRIHYVLTGIHAAI